ncbi:hypothetical protein [Prosthecobacter sp.]|uniref:hypothetical protein n=1 Tax=Prosthecobacter sp. TaxID=1965333 RepID=UPI0037835D53
MEPLAQPPAAAGASIAMLAGFGIICLVSFICWIKVLIALFKKEGAGLGILGLFCSIYLYIWGWLKSRELGLKSTMVWWTLCIVASLGLWVFAAASLVNDPNFKKGWEDGQRQIREQQRMQQPN